MKKLLTLGLLLPVFAFGMTAKESRKESLRRSLEAQRICIVNIHISIQEEVKKGLLETDFDYWTFDCGGDTVGKAFSELRSEGYTVDISKNKDFPRLTKLHIKW